MSRTGPPKFRIAQACTATSSGYLVIALFQILVRSGSRAEMDFGEVSFPLRVYRILGCGLYENPGAVHRSNAYSQLGTNSPHLLGGRETSSYCQIPEVICATPDCCSPSRVFSRLAYSRAVETGVFNLAIYGTAHTVIDQCVVSLS
ncbi:uncharacterized protein BDR25DRAFT_355285 [Lindgomyces ingoldianus]|uniref:Uncharacterized protein n=1 Tax=Lindgomyces ingoldianus TaxID=673940 RepID=A0ACB6QVB6_9PLEO|nr:uncharacterized protein BDR25DRAFT_355285 [Lindgomyces ingoldianus]KAF2470801.1 hypothetical protein BDR25DRAFT_355285 [Lindgomyces ingoldianus]